MPQEFHVIRCFNCEKFQVHQTRKDKKWKCKVCGEKQSLKKAYLVGPAKDCRTFVQELNFKDGERKLNGECSEEQEENKLEFLKYKADENDVDDNSSYINDSEMQIQSNEKVLSYLDDDTACPPSKRLRYSQSCEEPSINTPNTNGQTECQQSEETNASEDQLLTDISFDVDFDCDIESETRQEEMFSAKESNLASVPVKEVDQQSDIRRTARPKNKGFQAILKAAQNLA